jgi:hypothetical protein
MEVTVGWFGVVAQQSATVMPSETEFTMSLQEMSSYLVWGGVFLLLAASTAFQRHAWDIVFYCVLVGGVGVWLARAAWRKENPKR